MKLADLSNPKYIAFESFKKNGDAVNTPLWVVEENRSLYAWTDANSWKVKRVRNNSKVRVAVSNASGTPSGKWMEAHANIIDTPEEVEKVRRLVAKKYGFSYWMISLFTWFSRKNRVTAAIEIRDV